MSALDRLFFARDCATVAEELLGCRLVKLEDGTRLEGVIVETEAYYGEDDPASHAYRGETARNQVMFGEAGFAYVYLCYGIHHMFNITAGEENEPAAVLIRAVEPVAGVDVMKVRRDRDELTVLCDGPGKLCQAFGIDTALTGTDVTSGDIFVEDGSVERIERSGRIGVSEGGDLPLRFFVHDSAFVSR